MPNKKKQKKALQALNYDLFTPEPLAPPAPATIDTKIAQHAIRNVNSEILPTPVYDLMVRAEAKKGELPSVNRLYQMFDCYNHLYFQGKLPSVRIEYSNRMTNAGSYTPDLKLIKISRKYHEIFPEDITDTLKHEMIHIIHFYHNAAFKKEAKRIGASLKAKTHPSLIKKAKYIYQCPSCAKEYPRQKRLRMASCGYCSKGGKYDDRFKLKLKKTD